MHLARKMNPLSFRAAGRVFHPFPFRSEYQRKAVRKRKGGYPAGGFTLACLTAALLLFASCDPVFAATIGQDRVFNIQTISLLQASTPEMEPYVQVFNFFFTLQLFFGVYACFLRLVIRVFRM